MHARIAVDFRRRSLEDLGLHALGQSQHVDGAEHAGLGRLHRIALVMDGRRGTGQIVDFVHLDIEREADVVANQLEIGMLQQWRAHFDGCR